MKSVFGIFLLAASAISAEAATVREISENAFSITGYSYAWSQGLAERDAIDAAERLCASRGAQSARTSAWSYKIFKHGDIDATATFSCVLPQ